VNDLNSINDFKIVRLGQRPFRTGFVRAARLHMENIHHGLLPVFGDKFLSRLYCELDRSPGAGVWGAIRDDNVVGFIAGSVDVKKSYLRVLCRKWMPLLFSAGRSVLSFSVLCRIVAVLRHPFHVNQQDIEIERKRPKTKSEILAIAVDENYRHMGIAKRLVSVFEQNLMKWGCNGFYTVSTNMAEKDSNAFYRNAGFEILHSIKHNDLTLQVYQKKISG